MQLRHSSMTATRRMPAVGAAQPRTSRVPAMALLGGLFGSVNSRQQKKEQLLEAIKPLKRGLLASEEDKQRIDSLAKALERQNPTSSPLASELLNGQWELKYTTSESILGTNKPALLRPQGPIYQILDGNTLTARNKETSPLFNQVSAELIPESKNKVKVQFKEFKILGIIPVKAPPSASGELAITYLDEDLRISRGNRGNLFVLTMNNRSVKP